MNNNHIDKEIQEVLKKLQSVKSFFTDEEYKKILGEGAEIAKEAIANEAPVATGRLKKSIQAFTFKNTGAVFAGPLVSKKSKARAIAGKRLTRRFWSPHWVFVYYGTKYIAANKFIDRARDKSKASIIKSIKDATLKKLPAHLQKIFN